MNEFIVDQLNEIEINDFSLDISGNNIIWESGEGADSEIFFYDGSETIQLTDNDFIDTFSEIDGNNIVWNNGPAIALYNGSETIQLTDNSVLDFSPQISGDNVVWNSGEGAESELFLYDGSETIQLTNNNVEESFVEIDGDNVVWNSGTQIFLYNGSETIQLANDAGGFFPKVSGDNVVWNSASSDNSEIFLYDGSETIQLTDNNVNDFLPEVSGDNVVWLQGAGEGGGNDIFLYDGSETIQLTDTEVLESFISIDGDNVVWSSGQGTDSEIFFYDGSETIQITDNNIRDTFPQIDGNNIVWQSDAEIVSDSGLELIDINIATLDNIATVNETEATIDSDSLVYRFFNNNTGVHFYTADETEKDEVQELSNFSFEGSSYVSVNPLTENPGVLPVYRFLNQSTGVHLYTTSETERAVVQELDNFSFEGEVFAAYSPESGAEVEGAIPIYRFFNTNTGAHFYTPSVTERDNIEDNLPDFQSEGIAYYAFPTDAI